MSDASFSPTVGTSVGWTLLNLPPPPNPRGPYALSCLYSTEVATTAL